MKFLTALAAALVLLGAASNASAVDKKVERLYKARCGGCHGADGKSETEKGKKLQMASLLSPKVQQKTDAELKKAVLDGLKREENGITKEMDAFREELSEEQADTLVAYVRELGGRK